MQTQSCQQLMDKMDEEYGKIAEQINETQNAMKVASHHILIDAIMVFCISFADNVLQWNGCPQETYTEFMENVQTSTTRRMHIIKFPHVVDHISVLYKLCRTQKNFF